MLNILLLHCWTVQSRSSCLFWCYMIWTWFFSCQLWMDIFLKILLGCIYARLLPNHLCSLKKHAMVDLLCSLIFDLPLQPTTLHLSTKFIFWIFFQFWHFIILFCLVIWSLGWWHLDERSVFDTFINMHLKYLGPSCQFYFPSPNWILLNWHDANI